MAEVTASCAKCGSNNLITDDEPTDLSIVTCGDCGNEIGSWGDVQAAACAAVAKSFGKDLQSALGEAFKGDDDIKFTASSDEGGDVEDK